jgi:tetratricopeptide (TPR) repeat protein
MKQVASTANMRNTAMLGALRCSQQIGNLAQIIEAASELLKQEDITIEDSNEALYCRAKAYIAKQEYGLAVVDFTSLAKEVRTAWGAEAKYQLAYCYSQLGTLDMAEQEIMSFTRMQTSHQYWLAKSLILLSDIHVERNELFQAKQYLLALQANYKLQDDIPTIVNDKLQHISNIEQQHIQQTIEIKEEEL